MQTWPAGRWHGCALLWGPYPWTFGFALGRLELMCWGPRSLWEIRASAFEQPTGDWTWDLCLGPLHLAWI